MKKIIICISLLTISFSAFASEVCVPIDYSTWTQGEKNLIPAGAYAIVYEANNAMKPPSEVKSDSVCFVDPPANPFSYLNQTNLKAKIDQMIIDSIMTPEKVTQSQRLSAKDYFDSAEAPGKAQRAVVLVSLGEINNLRTWLRDFKAATAAATTLANLQTRVAALPDTPDRTATQLRTAIKSMIDNGAVDA